MVRKRSSRRGCKPPPARTVLPLFSTTRSPDTPAVAPINKIIEENTDIPSFLLW